MNAWVPRSACHPGCVAFARPPVPAARAAARWAALAGVLTVSTVVVLASPPRHRERVTRAAATALLRAVGVRLVTTGFGAAGTRGFGGHRGAGPGTLIVANHISWLDALALLAIEPATLLAKHEIRRWPVIGRLGTALGAQYIDRDRPYALPPAVRRLADTLRAGRSVVVFPEGTSWCGPPGGQFRRATFQAALDAGAPVRPMSIRYAEGTVPSTIAAFVGDDKLLASLRRIARADGLTVHVRAHSLLGADGCTRRELATAARSAVTSRGAGLDELEGPGELEGLGGFDAAGAGGPG